MSNAVQIVGNQQALSPPGIRDLTASEPAKRKSVGKAIMKEKSSCQRVTLRRPNMQSLQLEIEEHAISQRLNQETNGLLF